MLRRSEDDASDNFESIAETSSKYQYIDIRQMFRRKFQLQKIALEIFFTDGFTVLLVFANKRARDLCFFSLKSKNLADSVHSDNPSSIIFTQEKDTSLKLLRLNNNPGSLKSMTQRWQNGEISNFAYLMSLNTLAGRSYNDVTQYPVFPWILADYESSELNMKDPQTFRDLSKPMGAIGPDRAEEFKMRYDMWEDEVIPKFHYGSHYSSAAIVVNFLIRLEPFSRLACELQR